MTSPHSTTRDARLDFRLSQEHKRMVEQAATINGQSVSDFVIANVIEAARRTIDEVTVTRLSMHDRDTFLKLIEADATPSKALKAAADRYRERRA